MSRNTVSMAALVALTATGAHAEWYISEAAFNAALEAAYGANPLVYIENFDDHALGDPLNGLQTNWTAPGGNGYGWTAFAELGLYSNPGALATNWSGASIDFTFSGEPVTAFGGNLANTDFFAVLIAGTMTLTLSNGASQSVTTADGEEAFLAWHDPTPITSATLSVADIANWVQFDHGITGARSSGGGVPCEGDLNGDDQVGLPDLTILLAHFGTPDGAELADGDLDGDGDVDLGDLTLLLANFGTVCL